MRPDCGRTTRRLPTALIACLVFTAEGTALGATLTEPCALLTADEASAALGARTGEGRPSGARLCEWSAPAAPHARTLRISLQDSQAFDGAKEQVGHGILKEPAAGLGDDAVYVIAPKFAVSLAVRKNADVFFIDLNGWPLDANRDVQSVQAKERALALAILSRL